MNDINLIKMEFKVTNDRLQNYVAEILEDTASKDTATDHSHHIPNSPTSPVDYDKKYLNPISRI